MIPNFIIYRAVNVQLAIHTGRICGNLDRLAAGENEAAASDTRGQLEGVGVDGDGLDALVLHAGGLQGDGPHPTHVHTCMHQRLPTHLQ